MELTFYSGLQFFGFSSSSFTKTAEFVPLPGKASLVSISGAVLFLACLISVTSEIEFRGKCGVGMRRRGAEMSSRASSYLVYYIVWRVNLSKLSRKKDNNK